MKPSGMTGEKVEIAGVYQNKYGKQVTLEQNSFFPPCPDKNIPTRWQKADK